MPLSILDLPTELLLEIFTDTDLPSPDVYSLALVCRRLHFTALPVYFSRHGLSSSTKSAQITMRTDRRDLLAALRVALFETPLDHIDFIFSHPDPDVATPSATPLLEQFQRVERFLSDSTSIQKVSLDLDDRDHLSYLPAGSDEALSAWAKGFGELLNCIVETQCKTLTVRQGCYFAKAYQLSPTAIPPGSRLDRLVSQVKTDAVWQPPEFQRASRQGVAYVAITLRFSRASHLTCIHIHSITLILPPGLSWTLGVLRSCPISQLTFSKILMASDVWGTVLPLIASTGAPLTSVGFIDLDFLPDMEIMDFLPRLPALADITMSPSEESGDLYDRGFDFSWNSTLPVPPHLPLLTHLRADPVSVRYLLSRDGSLPALNTVTILFRPLSSLLYIVKMLTKIIDMLAAHPRRPAPLLAVAMTRSSEPPSPPGSDDVTPKLWSALDRVERLEVDWVVSSGIVKEAIRRIALRVALFRQVKHVAIKLEQQADLGDLPQRLAGSIARTQFLQAIEVNGREYPLVHGDI
ncbi:hypothetical protein DFH06DRAFT_1481600 [Mycena polygramma]|nr:hypothetical protein DFH06DRAFT_1481600 [Mycena polygramma]